MWIQKSDEVTLTRTLVTHGACFDVAELLSLGLLGLFFSRIIRRYICKLEADFIYEPSCRFSIRAVVKFRCPRVGMPGQCLGISAQRYLNRREHSHSGDA